VVFAGAGAQTAVLTAAAGGDVDSTHEQVQVALGSLGAGVAAARSASRVQVSVADDDGTTAAVLVSPTELSIDEGASAAYTVRLATAPASGTSVTVAAAIPVAQAGVAAVSPASVVFTPANWDRPQRFTVAGVDDSTDNAGLAARSAKVSHTVTSTDATYQGVSAAAVAVRVADAQPTVVEIAYQGRPDVTEGQSIEAGRGPCSANRRGFTISLSRPLKADERLEVPEAVGADLEVRGGELAETMLRPDGGSGFLVRFPDRVVRHPAPGRSGTTYWRRVTLRFPDARHRPSTIRISSIVPRLELGGS